MARAKKVLQRIIYENTYNPVLEYWEDISSKKVIVSKKVYLVYKELVRIINDPNSKWKYDISRSNHAIEFIENYCKHSKGKLGGKPFILEGWQKALVGATFGFVDKITGLRKHRELILVVARKNGKSTLAAAIGLYLQIADREAGAEIYAVATMKDQAKIIWQEGKRMVSKSPVLRNRIKPLVSEMTAKFNDSTFKPLGSDSLTLDGLNVHGGLLDEIHAWKDENLYDVVVDGTTARDQPLIVITTTAGVVRESIYDRKYDEATDTINGYLDGSFKNERLLPIIYELDSKEEWTKPECWQKANPGLGTIKKIDQLEDKVNKAKANNRLVKNLLTKDFNIRQNAGETWLNYEDVVNKETFNILELKPKYGIGGVDFSKTTDLTAAKVIFMQPNDDNLYVMSMYWLPADKLQQRIEEDDVPYDKWVEQGYLRVCEDSIINHKDITQWFLEIRDQYKILLPWIGYDSWSATYWVEEMRNFFGKSAMEDIRQGKRTLSIPMEELGTKFKNHKVIYNNNPIDRWCFANTTVDEDINGNIQPIKIRKKKRIDGTAALLNACVSLDNHKEAYLNLIR